MNINVSADPPAPTRQQRQTIQNLLDQHYDKEAERYKGGETDKSIAQMCGASYRQGWVSQIRVEYFGDGDGNEEENDTHEEVLGLQRAVEAAEKISKDAFSAIAALETENAAVLLEMRTVKEMIADLEKRSADLGKRISGFSDLAQKAITSSGDARSKLTAINQRVEKMRGMKSLRARNG